MIRFNISNAEAHLNNFGEAIKYLLDVLPYYQQKNNQYALGLAYANLSWCYFKSQKYPLAIDYAQKSHTIRTAINDKAGLAHLDLNLSKIFLETGQYDSCQQYVQAALEKSIALKLQTDVRDNYETLAMLNERRGNYAAANKYLHKFSDWKDSIYKQEKDEVLEKELIMFKTGAADKMNKELSASKKITGIYQILTLVLAMLLSVFAIPTIIRSRKKQEQNHQPVVDDLQEKENDRLHKELHAVQADYKKLEQALHHQQSTDISALRDMISSNKLHSDGYWNEFLLLFSKVYPDFFEKMKSEFPGLNQNDLRICALIKLNHSIPDMAKALNITVDSARKARYRLFKKLEFANDQELTNLIIRL
jgi:tetratricopeptide (TPR) repeat protein